jgi:protein gp37
VTAIEWTDATWNPTTGCDRVSPGCANCYALTLAARLKAMGQPRYQRDGDPRTSGPGFGLTLHPDKLDEPLRWRKPRMVFVNSMSDLFHEEVPFDFIAKVFDVMARAPQHTFQVLTKRPERRRAPVDSTRRCRGGRVAAAERVARHVDRERPLHVARRRPPRDPGGGAVHQRRAAARQPLASSDEGRTARSSSSSGARARRSTSTDRLADRRRRVRPRPPPDRRREWVRELRDACLANGTAFFFKQWGGATPKSRRTAARRSRVERLPLPRPAAYGWTGSLGDKGWTCEVDQAQYGHPANKRTWLYYVGPTLPPMLWGPAPSTGRTVRNDGGGGRDQRSITPRPFALALTRLARMARYVEARVA